MKTSYFMGTARLFRFMLRRDRLRITVWVLAISLFTIYMAPYFSDMYPTVEAKTMMAETMKNPATTLICGPVYSAENYHNGAMLANFILLFMAAIVAVMNIFIITRHTRADEELGRLEVVRSLPVGKLGNITAALLFACAANGVLVMIIGLGLTACGIAYIDFAGSMTFSAALGAVGIFIAALTAVCCQLSANNRTAVGISFTVTGASYLLRGLGDSGDIPLLIYTSPFGLAHLTASYVHNDIWPVLIILGSAVLMGILALYGGILRDLGAGLLPARPGKSTASPLLNSPLSLTVRLLRGYMATWTIAMLALCAVLGSLFGDLETLVGDNAMMAAYFAKADFTIIEEFLTMLMALIAIISTIPSVSCMMRLRSEEKHGYTEQLLSRSVGKLNMMAGTLFIAVFNAVMMMMMGTLFLWLVAMATIDGVPDLSVMLIAGLHYIPAICLMLGITVALIGLAPALSGMVHGYVGYCFIALFTVMMFNLPEWIERFSPYAYVPAIPLEDANPMVTCSLIGISAVLFIIGFMGFKKRDALFQ